MSTKYDPRRVRLAYFLAAASLMPGIFTGCACDDEETEAKPAKVLAFTALKTSVATGEQVTLSWSVENATAVKVAASPGGTLVEGSTQQTGTVVSGPIAEATTFTLLASSPGGDAMQMVTVSVAAPAEVAITQLAVEPSTILPNGRATITYATQNATRITLAPVDGEPIRDSTTQLNGTVEVTADVTTSFVLTAEGAGGPKTQTVSLVVEGTPKVVSFSAVPQAIELGESTTLRWEVMDAASVKIQSQDGAAIYDGSELTGSVAVSPDANETYRLTATSALGQEVQASLMVTVNRAAKIASFVASPSTVDYGDVAELRWSTSRAPGGVEISAFGRRITASPDASGLFTVTATRTTEYVLTAINPEGNSSAMATLTVNPIAPRIRSFTGPTRPARIGTRTTLAWSVLGATSLRLERGAQLLTNTSSQAGSFDVLVDTATATYTLTAINPNGASQAMVMVVGQNVPRVASFTAIPEVFTGTATITLAWDAPDATSTLLDVDGQNFGGFPGTSTGSFGLSLGATSLLTLTASNAVGSAQATVRVVRLVVDAETGNDAASATLVPGTDSGAAGSIAANDVDFYAVSIPTGGNVFAQVGNGQGGCNFDSFLTLYGPDGTTVIGTDDEDGVNSCSEISPERDAFARDLPAGTYYLAVRGYGPSDLGSYVLRTRIGSPSCGNRLTERQVNEQCDDGNTVSGDECSATCTIEPAASLLGPGGAAQTFVGGLRVGQVRYYQITMAAEGYIRAETFIPGVGSCSAASGSADPLLRLYSATTLAQLGSDDNDGLSSCALIEPRVDSWTRVPAGTYLLGLEENGNNAAIDAYSLVIQTLGVGCGNGVIESAAPNNELCDDANGIAGDGCDALCQLEGGTLEVEPNETFSAATPLQLSPGVTTLAYGTLSPITDVDFFRVDVPAGHHLDAFVTVNSLDSCPQDPGVRLELQGSTGSSLATQTQTAPTVAGPGTNCARIWPYTTSSAFNMAGGTYYLRVSEDGQNAEVQRYFVHVRVIAPDCGNTIIEGSERCDDGNLVGGDGCTATCQFEPNAIVALGAATTATVSGTIRPSHIRHVTRLDVTREVYLRAETFSPSAALGCADDTVIRLFDATGTTQLGSDDESGINSCSLILPTAPYARLAAGSYLLVTDSYLNRRVIPAFELVLKSRAVNECGNGVRETGVGEVCDDGNRVGGDGCSASCQVEPIGTLAGPPAGPQVFSGSISPAGDQDYIRLDVSAPAIVVAETGEPAIGACSADTLMRLFDANFAELGSDDDDGVGNCSLISGADTFARINTPGTYWLRVEDFSNNDAIPAYQIRVELKAQNACGNGLREVANNETCDDGNTLAGDGCSPTCNIEPVAVLSGPPTAPTVIPMQIASVGAQPFVQLDLSGPAVIIAETGAPTMGTCTGTDTVLTLLSPAGATLTSADQGGVGNCSLLSGVTNLAARLNAGTYFIRAEDFGNNGTIPAFELRVEIRPGNVCGNGVREAANNEGCDDGNASGGDGCSATCQLETQSFAGPTLPPTVVTGNLATAAQVDRYRIDVAAPGAILVAQTGVPTFGTCTVTAPAASADTLLRVRNNSDVQLLSNDSGGTGITPCSRIDGVQSATARLQPGTYFLSVEESGLNAVLGAYQLQVELRSLNVCGNAVREPGNNESCDDGNTAGGDGCSATCQIETLGTFTLPASGPAPGPVAFAGAISANSELDWYRLEIGQPAIVIARTGGPTIGAGCAAGTDTFLRLFDFAQASLTTNNDFGGTTCSRIDGTTTAEARLAPGTYFLRVEENGLNATIPAYELEVEVRLQGCGNGILEPLANESCDDSNTLPGDGCSAVCAVEGGSYRSEGEPNNTPQTARDLGALGPGIFDLVASSGTIGDLDFFRFTLASPAAVQFAVYGAAGAVFTSCGSPAFDTQMWLYGGVPTDLVTTSATVEPTLLEYDDDDGSGACSLISGTDTAPARRTLPAGTYYLQVREFGANNIIPAYFLRIDVQ